MHVAVVDPGVGTARRGIAVAAGDCVLVGPDNGLLSWAVAAQGGATAACQLTNGELWLHPVSPTFHGRDIFTPVAAHLAAGAELASVGTPIDLADLVTLPAPTSRVHDGEAEGEVMSVDRFGNVQLSIAAGDADRLGLGFGSPVVVRCGRRQLTVPYLETFAAVAPGEIVAYTDSAGLDLARRERRRRGRATRAAARRACPAVRGHARLSRRCLGPATRICVRPSAPASEPS